MPRRNNRAGQLNREAQKNRRAFRVQNNTAFKPVYTPPLIEPEQESDDES